MVVQCKHVIHSHSNSNKTSSSSSDTHTYSIYVVNTQKKRKRIEQKTMKRKRWMCSASCFEHFELKISTKQSVNFLCFIFDRASIYPFTVCRQSSAPTNFIFNIVIYIFFFRCFISRAYREWMCAKTSERFDISGRAQNSAIQGEQTNMKDWQRPTITCPFFVFGDIEIHGSVAWSYAWLAFAWLYGVWHVAFIAQKWIRAYKNQWCTTTIDVDWIHQRLTWKMSCT